MSNPKRPDLSAIPRLTEQLDGEELTAHFAVPQELLEQLREDDDATRVQTMPVGLLDGDASRTAPDSVHTSPTLPPPAPQVASAPLVAPAPQVAPAPLVPQASPAVVRVALPPVTDAELQAELRAMREPQRAALFAGLLVVLGLALLAWRLLA